MIIISICYDFLFNWIIIIDFIMLQPNVFRSWIRHLFVLFMICMIVINSLDWCILFSFNWNVSWNKIKFTINHTVRYFFLGKMASFFFNFDFPVFL